MGKRKEQVILQWVEECARGLDETPRATDCCFRDSGYAFFDFLSKSSPCARRPLPYNQSCYVCVSALWNEAPFTFILRGGKKVLALPTCVFWVWNLCGFYLCFPSFGSRRGSKLRRLLSARPGTLLSGEAWEENLVFVGELLEFGHRTSGRIFA